MNYKRIAYSFVIADLLHYGHIKILSTARENADYHVCGLISDEACHLWQGVNVCNFDERKAVLESLTSVDEVMKQETMDPTENLKAIRERFPGAELVVVHGDDWKTVPGSDYIHSIGGRIIQPEYYRQLSRDKIINKFKDSMPDHPMRHEFFTRHFSVGNIVHFSPHAAHPALSTKAETLRNFQPLLKSCVIERLFTCSVRDFQEHGGEIIDAVRDEFSGERVIVRSSAQNEDRYNASLAGCYLSVGGVESVDGEAVRRAIGAVIESYSSHGEPGPADQVLIQTQTAGIRRSGVVFTRNLESNTPYYLINYDDETGKTDTVTGGETGKSVWLYRGLRTSGYPSGWRRLMRAVREIEGLLPGMVLDIEFAEKTDGTVVIFQIRPLATNVKYGTFDDSGFGGLLDSVVNKYRDAGRPFLSDMAFWNPSEIIGDNPHPLDYSLYREIITRRAWDEGLVRLGYKNVPGELMQRYGNKPYIDVRRAFQSLIPESLGGKLADKLAGYYERKLASDLSAHDKIEFEISPGCWTFDFREWLKELGEWGFTKAELDRIDGAHKDITLSIIRGYKSHLKRGLKGLEKLNKFLGELGIKAEGSRDPFLLTDSFLKLLEAIKRLGTPQFASVAREAFVATALLRSLAGAGLFDNEEIEAFTEGISTVATGFDADFRRFAGGRLGAAAFMKRYGHLRAGTYDITARRYDRMDFSKKRSASSSGPAAKGRARPLDVKKLKEALSGTVLSRLGPGGFTGFVRTSITERERFKFEFTRALSLALELLAAAGELLGLRRDELCFLEAADIAAARHYGTERELKEFWSITIEGRRNAYEAASRLVLPPVIAEEGDFTVVHSWHSRPNFITTRTARGRAVNLDEDGKADVGGAIVLISKADPGFDWIFTRGIKGLITKYGGAASHMAIRAAEFNVPAAIGCGERIFNEVSHWRKLKLDCRKRRITPVID